MAAAATADPPFARVCLAGVGLIGGSIAMRARQIWPGVSLAGIDRAGVLDSAAARAVLDARATPDRFLEIARDCDLIILAAPVPEILVQIATLGGARALVTDTGSTKRAVIDAADAARLPRFVGGHPMAGSERSGLAEARADLFAGRPWFLVGATPAPEDASRLEAFVSALGAAPAWITAAAHDRAMAFVSHLPQVVAVALRNAAAHALGAEVATTAGRAFDDMTRLAASAPDVWEGILATNADFVAEAVAALEQELPPDAHALAGTWVREAFARARSAATPGMITHEGAL